MQKSAAYLAIVGGLVAVGIALSFYGSQIVIEDLISEQTMVISGKVLEVSAELDPTISEIGVYVVQTLNFKENAIYAKIFDPFGSQIVSKLVETNSFEDRFEISTKGTYQLVVENSGTEETTIVGVIGHMPDTSKLSIGITGFYILIVGLIGMVGVGIYAIKNRRKRRFS